MTTLINLLAMAAALWVGFYIVTRSLYSLLSWLAALTMWTLSSYFLCNALFNNIPGNIYIAWLQQLVILVLPLMLHLSYLLLPPPLHSRSLAALARLNRLILPAVYLVAALFILLGVLPTTPAVGLTAMASAPPSAPETNLGLMSRVTSPVYPPFVAFLALVSGLALMNLWQAREQARRTTLANPFTTFFIAVAIAGAGALYAGIGTALHLDIPTFPADLLLGVGVVLVGLAVARYSALLEGRALERDFIYTLLVVGALTTFYVLVVLVLYLGGQVSFVTLALTIVGTIAANSLFDALRLTLDRFFYRRQFQVLRLNLRELAHEAGTAQTMSERLQAILDALCRVLHVQQAFIALTQPDQFVVRATREASPIGQTFPLDALSARESIGLLHPEKKGLPGMKLLIPLAVQNSQIGALVLGAKDTRQNFSDADLDLVEDLSDQMAGLISGIRRQEENARELNAMIESFRERERSLQFKVQQMLAASEAGPSEPEHPPAAAAAAPSEETLLPLVEDALRHLHDPSYLGEHELASLRAVERCLDSHKGATVTFIDRGKAAAQVLEEALDKLRPDGSPPGKHDIPSREWHLYTILHDSYVLDEPNREIMARLYISEGTFNRTRRRALRALAKELAELEASVV